MKIPTLTDNPYALSLALRHIAAREREARRRAARPSFLQRLCKSHARREHTAHIDGLTIHSNLPS